MLKNCSISSLFLLLILISGCSSEKAPKSELEEVREDIFWLADDQMGGRPAGSLQEAKASNFIADHFLQFGLEPAGEGGTYVQRFVLEGPMVEAMNIDSRLSRNVLGIVRGTEHPGRYIVVGAHYDGQGSGGVISMDFGGEPVIHPSADDNASGTAGLLHLAEEFIRERPRNSILFAAFSGEELGLLGSRHFINQMEMNPDSILAMINLDMIGRLPDNNELNVIGTGTSSEWFEILSSVRSDSLEIIATRGITGNSDHAPFYDTEIPVLHYHTGMHEQYHRPGDVPEQLNYPGLMRVLDHAETTIRRIDDRSPSGMEFAESGSSGTTRMRSDGISLGVIPDYQFKGNGFRIERVLEDRTADGYGLIEGDIIVEMKDKEINDIYSYMDALNSVNKGEKILVKILRNDQETEITIQF